MGEGDAGYHDGQEVGTAARGVEEVTVILVWQALKTQNQIKSNIMVEMVIAIQSHMNA